MSGARYRHAAYDGENLAVTTYAGGLYERITGGTGTIHRFNIRAGSEVIAVKEVTTQSANDATILKHALNYLHRDHLGSVRLVTNASGQVVERLDYDAWGQRRNYALLNGEEAGIDAGNALIGMDYVPAWKQFHRGFTGHEMLDHLGFIHMNGRIYDATIGRFLSADPFVQFPESTQGFNRYTYVGNNPLSATDPSGFFSLKDALKTVVGIVASVYLGPILGGAIMGYLSSGNLQGAVLGMLGGALSFGIGEAFGHQLAFGGQLFAKSIVHGIARGALSVAGGGRFGDGFLGAFVSSIATPFVRGIGADTASGRAARVATAAAIGGTAATLGGGKFANGALSGAFTQAFNDEMAERHFEETLKKFEKNVVAHENISVTEQNGVTKIGISGTVGGAGVSPRMANRFIEGVEEYWEGRYEFDGKAFEITVNLEPSELAQPDFTLNIKGGLNFRASAMQGGNDGSIGRYSGPSVMAHEFGHMLGFGDMYTDRIGTFIGYENDIMGSTQFGSVHGYHATTLALKYGN